jgi:hypothetical protein
LSIGIRPTNARRRNCPDGSCLDNGGRLDGWHGVDDVARLQVLARLARAGLRSALRVAGVLVAAATLVCAPARLPGTGVIRRAPGDAAAPGPGSGAGQQFSGVAAVGALFQAGAAAGSTAGLNTAGRHFCTASVVNSPGGDLAVTAAHCVAGENRPLVFVPGYHARLAPYGAWLVTRVFTDPAWSASENPDDDVAFLQLAPASGVPVEDVTGAEQLVADGSASHVVRVIGYPSGADDPVWCVNRTHAVSPTQQEFDCGGYPDGTSGGPFLADVDPLSGQGSVVGVIGGYQQGGDTDAVSYSIVFGPNVASLYRLASAAG